MSVMVRFADVNRKVESVADLDRILDCLVTAGEPVLVELVGGSAVIHVGIGHRDAAVVLFRDADGQPWCARSRSGAAQVVKADLEFVKNETSYRFFSDAAVSPRDMREAAREFVRRPGVMPEVFLWVPEGGGAATGDGGEGGS